MGRLVITMAIVFLLAPLVSAANPLDETQSLLQTIIDNLSEIIDKLNFIAEKNETIIVEPPVVNVEHNISVYPNVTIQPLNEECEWETYSFTVDLKLDGLGTRYISVPDKFPTKEVNVTNSYVYFKWAASGNDKCTLEVNDVICLRKAGNSGQNYFLNSLEQNCLHSFAPGLNKIETSYTGGCFGEDTSAGDLIIEMQVKPANC